MDGGYGGYGRDYRYRIYLILHEQCTEIDKIGSQILRCLARLEKKHNSDIHVKYPVEGFENIFRNDVLSALKISEDSSIQALPLLFVILSKKLEDFHPDIHRFAVVDIGPYLDSSGQFNAIGFGRTLSQLLGHLTEHNDLFDELQELQKTDARTDSWWEVIDVKPKLGWFIFDLKKLLKKMRAHK